MTLIWLILELTLNASFKHFFRADAKSKSFTKQELLSISHQNFQLLFQEKAS